MENEFFIHVDDTPKRLFASRPKVNKTGSFKPCDMTPDDVDYEMATGKNREILEIFGMNQESLEHFILHYAKSYRYIHFFHCQLIKDFSPLEDLQKLESVHISWNIRTKDLWNFSKNTALRELSVSDAKQITRNPELLATSPTLENVSFYGSAFNNTPMDNLDVFGQMPNLKGLQLCRIRLNDKRLDFLKKANQLEQFHFDAGMLTTEEIAWIVANYPHLTGQSLCAYNTEDAILNDVRVCGFRKPGLDLPQHQKRLNKYIADFDALVEKYRNEP